MGKSKVEPKPKIIKRWSYSAWSSWNSCKFRYARKYLYGDKEPENTKALMKGNAAHKDAELYLKGEIKKLPRSLDRLVDEYSALKKMRPIVEKFWGVDPAWKPKDWDSWVVMKMDAAIEPKRLKGTLFIQDLKTGRYYPSHEKQGDLYAAIGMGIYPTAKNVETEFWYSDTGDIKRFGFTAKEVAKRIVHWKMQGAEMLKTGQKFPKNPSEDNCRWCFLRTDKGGICDGWKKLRNARSGGR